MIVIDLGCHEHEISKSVEPLIERFHPDTLYGFDPLLPEGSGRMIDGTRCILKPLAAWVHNGKLALERRGTGTRVYEDPDGDVLCFDLADFLIGLGLYTTDEQIILKLDVEGAEYPLLSHLRDQDLDKRLSLVLVEWHGDARIELRCPMEEWTL